MEVFLTLGSYSDTAALKNFAFDLPCGATVYGDKAYNEYLTEDLSQEASEITLLPLRKKNSKRQLEAFVVYVQHYYRKAVETVGSALERLLLKSIRATSARGFELEVFLFVLAHSLSGVLLGTNLSDTNFLRWSVSPCCFCWRSSCVLNRGEVSVAGDYGTCA